MQIPMRSQKLGGARRRRSNSSSLASRFLILSMLVRVLQVAQYVGIYSPVAIRCSST